MAKVINAPLDSDLLARFGIQNNQIICDTGETLTVLQIARVLHNQRLVCKCLFNKQEVYVKIFTALRANTHADREASGVKLLNQANILTPNLLLETTTNNQPILVITAINNAQNAEVFMQTADFLTRKSMAQKLVKAVALHHNANLIQTDIHLKNFLIANKNIVTIDGDGIRKFSQLKDDHAIQNLCVLLSKFDVLDLAKWQLDLSKIYSDTRTWREVVEPEKLAATANLHRLTAASHYADIKVFRQCSDVNVTTKNTAMGGLFYAASSDININIRKNMAEIDALMQPQNMLKNGNTCTVVLIEIAGKKVVIKRYNIKSFWHGISRAFRPSRAAASWANAHRLSILGVATAKPIALLEQRIFGWLVGGLRGKAYFLAEYVDAPDAAQYFAREQDKTQRAEAVKNIVTLFYKLLLLQISHGDMKASNIKMVDNKPVLIDLDSMRQHSYGYFAQKAHVRDLKRFMQNWLKQPALYNAFVKTFKVIYDDTTVLQQAGIGQNKEISHKEISHKEISE